MDVLVMEVIATSQTKIPRWIGNKKCLIKTEIVEKKYSSFIEQNVSQKNAGAVLKIKNDKIQMFIKILISPLQLMVFMQLLSFKMKHATLMIS